MERYEILKKIANEFGPSTYEDKVINLIKDLLGNEKYSFYQTPHKNLIVLPKYKNNFNKTIFLQAHLDELGFRIFKYKDDGLIQLTPLSPIQKEATNFKIKFFPTEIKGILIVKEENRKKKYFLDIGAEDKKKAEEILPFFSIGAYDSQVELINNNFIGKSLDDRSGCAVIVNVLKEIEEDKGNNNRIIGIFTAREETGNWPINEVVEYCKKENIIPDFIINLENCPAEEEFGIKVGKGVGIGYADKYYCVDYEVYKFILEVAEKYNIKFQKICLKIGGGEMGALSLKFGIKGASFLIPNKYIHLPNSMISAFDFDNCIDLVKVITKEWR